MLTDDLIRKVKRIEISTRRVIDDVMSGRYRSHFKGHGMQFSEHRVYAHGDDVRHIDWKVTARTREPVIKKYEEERELTVFLVVDMSASKNFGSESKLKSEVAAELGGMLAYAATHTGDRVGVLLFAGEVEEIIPPRKGQQHVLRVIRDILAYEPKTTGTDLAGALEATSRIMKHSGVVFVISDFLADDYDVQLKRLANRHDVVAIWVGDDRETKIPDTGTLYFEDPETGQEFVVDTASYAFKKWFKDFNTTRETDTLTALKGRNIELLRVSTREDYADALVRFFGARKRRAR